MPSFDRLMIDPTAGQIARVLVEAEKAANSRSQEGLLRTEPAEYANYAPGVLRRNEGASRWGANLNPSELIDPFSQTTLVGIAWWSDYLHSKHVRVSGRRMQPALNLFNNRRFAPLEPEVFRRPPLWLVYPYRVALRTLPGRTTDLLVACDCGAVGTPATIAWMGDCCGPCHDYREETGRNPTNALPVSVRAAPIRGVAFSTKGTRLAAVDAGGEVAISCVRGSGQLERRRTFPTLREVEAFGSNGRLIVVAGEDGSRVYNFAGEKLGQTEPEADDHRDPLDVAISPSGAVLAETGHAGLRVWERAQRDWELVAHERAPGNSYCVTFSPNEELVAVGLENGTLAFFDRTDDLPNLDLYPLEIPGELAAVSFAPDGESVAIGTHTYTGDFEDWEPGRVGLFDRQTERFIELGTQNSVTSVAFSPDGNVLASAGWDLDVKFWDVSGRREIASLEWHVASVTALAFSPDGETLATGGADGVVKLWPWRDLISP